MTTATAPTRSIPRPIAPKAPAASAPPKIMPTVATPVVFGKPNQTKGKRVVIYGTGGIGKTSLALLAPGPVAFFDLDDSLGTLQPEGALVVEGVSNWAALREALASPGWNDVKTLVIDSVTKAEELCVEHVIETVTTDKGARVRNIEGYGYGKGYRFVYDTFLTLLSQLESHVAAGRNVILIAHDCTVMAVNPAGDDFQRYEPRLQGTDKASVRLRVKEWADVVLFLGYDIDAKDGKGRGQGTRTIWPTEQPHCVAKFRSNGEIPPPLPYAHGDDTVWQWVFAGSGE